MRIIECKQIINLLEDSKHGNFIDSKLWNLKREKAISSLKKEIICRKIASKNNQIYMNSRNKLSKNEE